MSAAEDSGFGRELLDDYLWKIGIVLVLVVVAVTAMVLLWRRADRSTRRGESDAQDR